MSLRILWRGRCQNRVPVLLSGLTVCFGVYGILFGMKFSLTTCAVAALVLAAVYEFFMLMIFRGTIDTPVEFEWERSLLNYTVEKPSEWVMFLCRHHRTTRVQGRVLGCGTALRARDALRELSKNIGVVSGEIKIETTSGIEEVAEYARAIEGLFNMAIVANQILIPELNPIAKAGATKIPKCADALLTDLPKITDHLMESVRSLDRLVAADNEKPGSVSPFAVQEALRNARVSLEGLNNRWLPNIRGAVDRLYPDIKQLWEDDHCTPCTDPACVPVARAR